MEEVIEKQKKNTIVEYIKVIVITLLVTYGVLYFVQISKVYGTSMEPTYVQGNVVIVDKVFYKNGTPAYNDIVVVDYFDSQQEETYIIKRVVGIGGDRLEIKDNQLYRNGELIEESYINGDMNRPDSDMVVDIPEGKIFVMGDNRDVSLDSRMLGYFDFDKQVIGKVILKLF